MSDLSIISDTSLSAMTEHVGQVYLGSDAARTRSLYRNLESIGSNGQLAANLLRAQKSSARAKVYWGRGYKDKAYERKNQSLQAVVRSLPENKFGWGWGRDDGQQFYPWVLYVDLPTGQVSFHSDVRGDGPDYPRVWDGIKNASPERIIQFAAKTLVDDGYFVDEAD